VGDRRVRVAGKLLGKVRTGGIMLTSVLVASLGGALADPSDAAPGTYFVVIEQMRFNPPTLTVQRGDRVVWINKDLFPHTASATSKAFDSLSIAPNASWSYVVRQPGSYPYPCNFHPAMHGTLTVRQGC
jgi:plastocyanin